MSKPTTDQLAAVAYLANAINPKWDRAGIESVLRRLAVENLAAITHAAITAAATRQDQRTPHIIGQTGNHWASCTGDKPTVARTWSDPLTGVTPAPAETIQAMRHRLGHHATTPNPDCPECEES